MIWSVGEKSVWWGMLAAGATLLAGGCSGSTKPVAVKDPAAIAKAAAVEPAEGDWPWWMGPTRDNHAAGELPPLTWDENTNVVWRADLSGSGHASPIVEGDAVFVATADEKSQTKSLICLDRQDGKQRWQTIVHRGSFMHIHPKNSQASATPACDGEQVYTVFMIDGGIWATALDRQGEIVWQTKAGDFRSLHGYGSSPLLYKSLLIVAGDSSGGGFLTALYRDSGEIAWRTARESNNSFGTPILMERDGKQQIVLAGHSRLIGYDPDTGQELWNAEGPAATTANTVVSDGSLIFASGGHPERNLYAVDPATGSIAWQQNVKVYVPSLLTVGKRLLALSDDGVARLYEADSGKRVWQERLGGDFTASPVACGEYVFATNEAGLTYVFRAGDKLEPATENQLGTHGFATPVICGGRLYLRTENALYCIGN
ncbi:outer membrane protein assembly factor BamB family protein [Lignipirellula cremea]|uniref:Outer membrane biogenesis protein BamB n=1 Tax=Lignipirellula cremea TaxID=2528010 RepID=A0A518DMT8_9BACT|nr:PQQ-binding-like beta-propeller repeat protein [Lignipirellula cremea]QDU93156.1 outer membrane biogenesis protein BamB [Lignipirellula cremea]